MFPHRFRVRRSFTVPRWVEYIGAYAGVLAVQGDPAEWVTTHRTHHIHSDKAGDPHSPCEGFGWGHIGWIFDNRALHKRLRDGAGAADLREQAYYRFLADTNFAHVLGSAYLLFLAGGWPVFLWGFCFRAVFGWHATFAINSACHTWGNRPFRTTDHSRNLWWVALFTFGEGWHNNHHAFSYSARHGLEWWQLDATWCAFDKLSRKHSQRAVCGHAEVVSTPCTDTLPVPQLRLSARTSLLPSPPNSSLRPARSPQGRRARPRTGRPRHQRQGAQA